jgi:ferredoxin
LPEYNSSLIINILDEIISLKNLFIITELYPKLYSNFSDSIKRINTIIINNSMETNIFDTYIYAILKKQEILNYAFTTNQYDNSSFKHKQDKKKYISKEPINNIINNDNKILLNNNSKIQLGLNTIANKLWYYISDDDDIKNSNMVFSKFHIIHPNIRNHTNNIYNINIKYYNYIDKKIEQEFEEIFEMGNEIKLTRDDNGFNLEIKAFKDIYIKILEKIFSFFFEFENDFIEYNLSNVSCSHRVVRMNSISIDYSADNNWEDCANLCPTNAFTLELKEFFDDLDMDLEIDLADDALYPYVNEKMCIGCGACVEISHNKDAIELDRYIGPIVHSRNLEINHEACVNCFLCEENCPRGAIELVDGEVVLDDDKCIRCVECTRHCPVGALKRVEME